MAGIFICYRREDSEVYAALLADSLTRTFGEGTVFRDAEALQPGQDFVDAIDKVLGKASLVLVLIGPKWLEARDEQGVQRLKKRDDQVRIEIRQALIQEKHVIPVLVGGAIMPTSSQLQDEIGPLARRHAIELTNDRLTYDVGRLTEAIDGFRREKKTNLKKDALPRWKTATEGLVRAAGKSMSQRWVLFVSSLLLSIVTYDYLVSSYAPDRNLLAQLTRLFDTRDYAFFTGGKGGFYIKIGEALDSIKNPGGALRIKKEPSSGALENARSVMNKPRSFGVVQEDTLRAGDFTREHLRYVAPLYLERMHILYRHDRYREFAAKRRAKGLVVGDRPILQPGLKPGNYTYDFLAQSVISSGPPGSGTREIASFLISGSGIRFKNDLSADFKPAADWLADRGEDPKQVVDVVFSIAGAPLEIVQGLLKDFPISNDGEAGKIEIGLLPVDPSLRTELNRNYGLSLRVATFKKIYPGGEKVSAIGSYAFLIASKDVPTSEIMKLLSMLEDFKAKLKKEKEESAQEEGMQYSALEEFDFYETFKTDHERVGASNLKNMLLFGGSVPLMAALIMWFVVVAVSSVKQAGYFKSLFDIYGQQLPQNYRLVKGKGAFPTPTIYDDQTKILEDLTSGMSELLILAKAIRADYSTGGITVTHHRHLIENVTIAQEVFKRNIAQRLNFMKESGTENLAPLILELYTAGFLRREEYADLSAPGRPPGPGPRAL